MVFRSFPFSFSVPLAAFGEQRARSSAASSRPYTPAETVAARRVIVACAMSQVGELMLSCPLQVVVVAGYVRPKRPRHEVPTCKPDWDNVGKIICDACNGTLWTDDAVISDATVHKRYMDVPRMVVMVNSRPTCELPFMDM